MLITDATDHWPGYVTLCTPGREGHASVELPNGDVVTLDATLELRCTGWLDPCDEKTPVLRVAVNGVPLESGVDSVAGHSCVTVRQR